MSLLRYFSSKETWKYFLVIMALMLIAGIQVIHDSSQNIIDEKSYIRHFHQYKDYIKNTKCSLLGCQGHPNINEVQASDLPNVLPESCIATKPLGTHGIQYLMCIKSTKEDDELSGAVLKEGMFEPECVGITADIAREYPEATFIDIGANIGTHSLAALQNGNKVVSVEPLATNLAYISKSAYLNGKQGNLRFLQNAVSNVSTTVYSYLPDKGKNSPDKSNGGSTSFFTKDRLPAGSNPGMQAVKSVQLEQILDYINPDVAFIKIDAEGKDCMIIRDYIWKPNKKVFIPYIMMEWMLIYNNYDDECPDFENIVEGLYQAGYTAHEPHKRGPVIRKNLKNIWDNMLWVHKDARKIQLSNTSMVYYVADSKGILTMVKGGEKRRR